MKDHLGMSKQQQKYNQFSGEGTLSFRFQQLCLINQLWFDNCQYLSVSVILFSALYVFHIPAISLVNIIWAILYITFYINIIPMTLGFTWMSVDTTPPPQESRQLVCLILFWFSKKKKVFGSQLTNGLDMIVSDQQLCIFDEISKGSLLQFGTQNAVQYQNCIHLYWTDATRVSVGLH